MIAKFKNYKIIIHIISIQINLYTIPSFQNEQNVNMINNVNKIAQKFKSQKYTKYLFSCMHDTYI